MRLELFDVRRRWPRQRTQRDDERGFVNSGILFFTAFYSIRRPYITIQTPTRRYGHASTPPQFLPISGDRDVSLLLSLEWPVWSSSSGNNCHAVHMLLSSGASLWSGTFTLSHIISRAHLRDFFRLLTIGMCHFRYLRNGRCDRHRAEITIMQFIGHSLPVHHFFLRHSENFYLVSYCEPRCILHIDHQRVFSLSWTRFSFGGVVKVKQLFDLSLSCQIQVRRGDNHELKSTLMDKDVLSSVFVLIHLPFSC